MAMEDCFDYLDAPMERVTGADIPTPYAENLESMSFPKVHNVINVVKRVCFRDQGAVADRA